MCAFTGVGWLSAIDDCLARQCALAKLWTEDASRAIVKVIHRCASTTSKRSGQLILVVGTAEVNEYSRHLEYSSTGQGQDIGANGRMDRDVCVQCRFGDHGTTIYETEESE